MNSARSDSLEDLGSILPEKTPLFIGVDVVIEGKISFTGTDPSMRLVVLGTVRGDIHTKGILQIAKGATVQADSIIECGQIVVAGNILGSGVTIKAGILMLEPTGNVEVDLVCLPPGGLEQMRGGVLNARLDMSSAHEVAATDTIIDKPKSVGVTDSFQQMSIKAKTDNSTNHSFTSVPKSTPSANVFPLGSNDFSTSSGTKYEGVDLAGAAPQNANA